MHVREATQDRNDRYLSGMPVTLCVLLHPVPGSEQLLVEYEDKVLRLLSRHDARIVQRVRSEETGATPYEVHILEFASEAVLDAYMVDPDRIALAAVRDPRSIAPTCCG